MPDWLDGTAQLVVDDQPQGEEVPIHYRMDAVSFYLDHEVILGPSQIDGIGVVQFCDADGDEIAWLDPNSRRVFIGAYVDLRPDIRLTSASICS